MGTRTISLPKYEVVDNEEDYAVEFEVSMLARHITAQQMLFLINTFSDRLIIQNVITDDYHVSACFNGSFIQINNNVDSVDTLLESIL